MDTYSYYYALVNGDGSIIRIVHTSSPEAPDGYIPVAADVTVFSHWWNGTEMVAYTPEQYVERTSKRLPPDFWSNATMSWIDPRTLAEIKQERVVGIKSEALKRIQVIYEGVDSFGTLEVLLGLWTQGLANAAKQPQGDWAAMLQIVNAARTAIVAVKASTSAAEVDAVVVNWP